MTFKHFFTSSIGKKFSMAFTGLFLILFLIVHAGINSCIFLNDHGITFNKVARFMSHNWIMRFMEIGLFAGLILHAVQGLLLWKQNNKARPVAYQYNQPSKNSSWYSRSMGILGTLLLLFIILHLSHFYVGTKIALYSGDTTHNLFKEMDDVFKNLWIIVLYLCGVIVLALVPWFSKCISDFWNSSQKIHAINKNAGHRICNYYMPAFCFNANCNVSELDSIIFF